MDLTTMRANVRKDLHDEDSGNYRWTDAVLNRHIDRAVKEYQVARPRSGTATVAATASRRYDLSAQSGYLWCERVEYPIDDDPPKYLEFREEGGGSVYLLCDEAPVAGQNIKFWYARAHTLEGSSSTIPVEDEELVALGAAAHAAIEWANYAVGRINVGERTAEQYKSWGEAGLAEFRSRLESLCLQQAFSSPYTTHWGAVPKTWKDV